MTLPKAPEGLPEGIYFDLSNDDYHNDPALSHSGMTKVLISWPDYWTHSCHNPDRKKYEPTDAMKFGDRSGMYLLEKDKFYEKYATYKRNAGNSQGIYLSSVEYDKIRTSIDCIREVPIANEYFSNGYPEVSIFFMDKATGVMLRVKIDYLRTFGAIDFKRIKAVDPWEIGNAVTNQGLDIQNHLYLEGIKDARLMLQRKKPPVFGNVDPEWLAAFAKDEDLLFRFVFQRSTPPYIWKIKELEREVLNDGAKATRKAIELYMDGARRFGFERPVCGTGDVETISQYHVRRRSYD